MCILLGKLKFIQRLYSFSVTSQRGEHFNLHSFDNKNLGQLY